MRLPDDLAERDLSHEAIAETLGVHPTTVYRLCSSLSFSKRSTIRQIIELTKGGRDGQRFSLCRASAAPRRRSGATSTPR